MSDSYFEDYQVGEVLVTNGVTVTESMIVEFSLHYDPQPFHMDVEAAKSTHFGGLVSSGILTMALASRLIISERIFAGASMGSPGIDELRWRIPVRPGDTLRVRMEVLGKRPSSTRSDRGYLDASYQVLNQRDEAVMTYRSTQILATRPGS